MSTHDDDTQVITAPENGYSSPRSVLDVLRAKRAEQTREHTYDIEVPGYSGLLVLRCGPLSGARLARLAEKREASHSPDRNFNANADTLLAACTEVLGRTSPDDELRPLDLDEPMQIDARLADGLGLEAGSGRELVRQLFGAAPIPDLALGTAVSDYLDWARAVNADVDETFTGESPAAPR